MRAMPGPPGAPKLSRLSPPPPPPSPPPWPPPEPEEPPPAPAPTSRPAPCPSPPPAPWPGEAVNRSPDPGSAGPATPLSATGRAGLLGVLTAWTGDAAILRTAAGSSFRGSDLAFSGRGSGLGATGRGTGSRRAAGSGTGAGARGAVSDWMASGTEGSCGATAGGSGEEPLDGNRDEAPRNGKREASPRPEGASSEEPPLPEPPGLPASSRARSRGPAVPPASGPNQAHIPVKKRP
jgi:hypothetical protein